MTKAAEKWSLVVVSGEDVRARAAGSWIDLLTSIGRFNGRDGYIHVIGSPNLAHQRTVAMEQFLATGREWALMVDSDIQFTPTDWKGLSEYAKLNELDVCVGAYKRADGALTREGLGFTAVHCTVAAALEQDHPFSPTETNPAIVMGRAVGEDELFFSRAQQFGFDVGWCEIPGLKHLKVVAL